MRVVTLLALCAVSFIDVKSKTCKDLIEEECIETEYHSYIECVGNRIKRSTDCLEECDDCENNCRQCDCDYCATNTCQDSCTSCCPSNPPPCSTNRCCHRTCHARCRSATCRNGCKSTCREMLHNGGGNVTITQSHPLRHNITTVVNLHNVINNTNIIDVPIQINKTNMNNRTFPLSDVESISSRIQQNCSAQVEKEVCCYVIGPRQCEPTKQFPYVRCYHSRRKECGAYCNAAIVHEQPHQVCDQIEQGTSCQQQIMYVPQPQPRCAYQPNWPYVSCGIPQQQYCGGCYAHYNSLYSQYPPQGCPPNCYDDGYGIGPYYRQGPFYRPGYAHVPSCYQTNTCGFYDYSNFGGNYGYPPPNNSGGGVGGFVGYPPNTYANNIYFEPTTGNYNPSQGSIPGNYGGPMRYPNYGRVSAASSPVGYPPNTYAMAPATGKQINYNDPNSDSPPVMKYHPIPDDNTHFDIPTV